MTGLRPACFRSTRLALTPRALLWLQEVHRKMQTLAALLLATPAQHPKGLGLKPGDRVLLVYPPGLEFIVAFLACLRAGVVAVPVYPPDPRKMKKDITMFIAVASNCGAQVALTCGMYYNIKKIAAIKQKLTLGRGQPSWPEHLSWVVTDDLVALDVDAALWRKPDDAPSARDLAFLQYTSGSTSAPKGVMLSHGNLNHNLRTISSALIAGRDTVVVSWLPQYHDMGLIGAYLGTLFNGGTGVYMSPFSFIKDPMLWIRLMSKHRATHLQAPNFAYALCARKVDRLEGATDVNLSSVRHMINGAEPIQGDAMDAFYKAFAPFGLPPDVVKPTYGLAEHTVYVCGSGAQRLWVDKAILEKESVLQPVLGSNIAARRAQLKEMIGCGIPSRKDHGIDLRIVDPETSKEQPDGRVGEIWISSASKAGGYFGEEMKEISAAAFRAKIVPSSDGDRSAEEASTEYLRTGDFGVIFQKELFICGRMKDLVIIRGRNHYPQDIEATAESHEELRPGCSAAFSFSDGADDHDAEKLALVAELRDPDIKNKASLCGRIRSAIAREHGVKVTLIVLVKPRSIPKTTSGKISRARAKKALDDKQLDVLYRNEDMIGDAPDNGDGDEQLEGAVGDAEMDRRAPAPTQSGAPAAQGASQKVDAPPQEVFQFLLSEVAQLLDVDKAVLNPNTPLQELGLDSMALTQLQGIVNQKYHVNIQEEVLYNEATTLKSLQVALCGGNVGASGAGQATAAAATLSGESAPTRAKKPQKLVCGCIAC
ncbi:hypothetical protein ATCC90586_001931 [Pythium insidiosum]|nr:hypothetical protein ATCC90586_001931 [Pythium insidiosum]